MPVMKCANGGYKWGASGKCFNTRSQAEAVGRAIMAQKKKRGGKRGGKRK